MIYEAFLHQYFNVIIHNNFWNESNQTPFGFDTTGRKASKSSIDKMLDSRRKIGLKQIAKKDKATKSDPLWKETIGKQQKKNEKITKSDPLWKETVLVEQMKKRKESIGEDGFKLIGKKVSDYHKTRELILCEYCNNEFDYMNYGKYHGEKCKCHPNYIEQKKETIICPFCNKLGTNRASMYQWHFDNCKKNPNYIEKLKEIIECPKCGLKSTNKSIMKRWHFDNCRK